MIHTNQPQPSNEISQLIDVGVEVGEIEIEKPKIEYYEVTANGLVGRSFRADLTGRTIVMNTS